MVTVAAVAIAGAVAGAAIATTVGIGAAIAGTAAVASQAISDRMSGEVSDASAYMWAGGRESFIGALSSAVFGPFGTGKNLSGKMLLGGITNGFEGMVRRRLENEEITFGNTMFDVGIGMLTAWGLHNVGKLFNKASPWVKRGVAKVSDAIENAINKFKNMAYNLGSRFENKLAIEGMGSINGISLIDDVKLKPTSTQIAYNEAMKEAADNQMKKAVSEGSSSVDLDDFNAKTATTKQKGNFGEIKADNNLLNNKSLKDAGYNLKSIGRDAPSGVNDKIVKGIDGLYENANPNSNIKYVIDEAKFGTSKLGKTKDGLQMSDDWLTGTSTGNNRILSAVDGDRKLANKIIKALEDGNVERVLSKIDSNGNVTTHKLDAVGNIIGVWP